MINEVCPENSACIIGMIYSEHKFSDSHTVVSFLCVGANYLLVLLIKMFGGYTRRDFTSDEILLLM